MSAHRVVPESWLTELKNRVNTLASLSLKAERYAAGAAIKHDIAIVLAAAPQPAQVPAEGEAELRWVIGGKVYGRPTADDAMRYAAEVAPGAVAAPQPDAVRELCDVIDALLKTRDAEAKTAASYTVALENFNSSRRERDASVRAMLAASEAEAKARATLAKHRKEGEQ